MKKTRFLIISLISISFITACNSNVVDSSKEFNVNVSNNNVNITNQTAIKGHKYETKLTSSGSKVLPDTLSEVTINHNKIYDFDYGLINCQEANFSIDANYVTGPININLDPVEGYDVTVSDGIELKQGTEKAVPGKNYKTTLTVANGGILPANRDDVTVTIGEEAEEFDYFEYIKKSDTEASFLILSEYVNGDISINIKLKNVFVAEVYDWGGIYDQFTLSNTVVDPSKDFETTISFSAEDYPTKRIWECYLDPSYIIPFFYVQSSGVFLGEENFTYTPSLTHPNEATLIIKKEYLFGNILIMPLFDLPDKSKWYDFSDWWNYCSQKDENGNYTSFAATGEDIGKIVGVEVNGLIHQVRLIDVDHDDLADGSGKAHCTFEFANLISDKEGAEMYKWTTTDLGDFINSTINKNVLAEDGSNSIFKKMPTDLQGAISTVTKKSMEFKYSKSKLLDYDTKLFIPSVDEIGLKYLDEGELYKFYTQNASNCLLKYSVQGYAFDYWTRTSLSGYGVFYVTKENGGGFSGTPYVYYKWYTIAPAFCI